MARSLLFALPYALQTPRLINPELGLVRVISRTGDSTEVITTLLDTPDHRLMRAGVVLSHQVCSGVGTWHLTADGWHPDLPSEVVLPVEAASELPVGLAEIIRPLRRRAPIGPVAGVETHRSVYRLISTEGLTAVTLSDATVTIRRGGVTTGRFRDVTMEPTKAASSAQVAFLTEVLLAAGAIEVKEFDDLTRRLGVHHAGLSDFPAPTPLERSMSVEEFVSALLARHLRELLKADLASRRGGLAPDESDQASADASITGVQERLRALSRCLAALDGLIDPQWSAHLQPAIDDLVRLDPSTALERLDDHYFALIDDLVLAVRSPKVGSAQGRARAVLRNNLITTVGLLTRRCSELAPEAADEDWTDALELSRKIVRLQVIGDALIGKKSRRLAALMERLQTLLEPACVAVPEPDEAELAALSGPEGFAQGREWEHRLQDRAGARASFVDHWRVLGRKLTELRMAL